MLQLCITMYLKLIENFHRRNKASLKFEGTRPTAVIIGKIKIFPAFNFCISSAKGGRPVKFSITEYIITRSTYLRRTKKTFPRHL